jgi:hypothetical protein
MERIVAILAERILGWTIGADRFLIGQRRWISLWRFQPFKKLQDAFRLLDKAASEYSLVASAAGTFTARVRVGSRIGKASGKSMAAAATLAIARAIGLDVPDSVLESKQR